MKSVSADPAVLHAWPPEHHAERAELLVGRDKEHTTPSRRSTGAIRAGWIDSLGWRIDDERHRDRSTRRPDGPAGEPVLPPDRNRPTAPGGVVNLYSWPRLAALAQVRSIRPWRHPSR